MSNAAVLPGKDAPQDACQKICEVNAPVQAAPHVYPPGCAFHSLTDIAGKKITVMGLGLNHGGEESARFFLAHGAALTVTDTRTRAELLAAVEALEAEGGNLRFVLGEHRIPDFADADVVIKNPGIKYDGNEYLAAARAIETDISVFLAFTKAPVIAVTGSKGKSSTASAVHFCLCCAGFTAFLGGNITVNPLSFLLRTGPDTPVVLELSSWQLADLRGRGVLKPTIAVITPIFADHQNWYGAMAPYIADKKLIYADQDDGDWTVCAAQDQWAAIFERETRGRFVHIPELEEAVSRQGQKQSRLPAPSLPAIRVPGEHNRRNALTAATVLSLLGVAPDSVTAGLAQWPGIPHRLEYFHTWQLCGGPEVRFYNDTTATVPEAAAAAIHAFDRPVHLVAGGTDKHCDWAPLAAACGETASIHLLAGTGTDRLTPLLTGGGTDFYGPYDSLDALLGHVQAFLQKIPGRDAPQTVVFSPGATSFGMFKNEFDRGDTFKAKVREQFSAKSKKVKKF
ncbi:MAG: UDP-N-acetylmuramoyl-L-alanine--D-glutamate ligase [Spirochaetaceae bacterium]|jgi:UDP-N-acetylmuramoylalanine--D-glutamate ligase|nr:UDP-N-acetylmuramoyl-L-alanine--D-glutamate ligase [Spirochaetaceae bacterium]